MMISPQELTERFDTICTTRMQGLPILNEKLSVEAVGFRQCGEHEVGVLLTPWFMNLVLLPGTDEWDSLQSGETVSWSLPHGDYDFTVSRDEELGTYLSAILFRSVNSIPTQEIAHGIAEEIAELVFTESEPDTPMRRKRPIGRREFLTGLRPG